MRSMGNQIIKCWRKRNPIPWPTVRRRRRKTRNLIQQKRRIYLWYLKHHFIIIIILITFIATAVLHMFKEFFACVFSSLESQMVTNLSIGRVFMCFSFKQISFLIVHLCMKCVLHYVHYIFYWILIFLYKNWNNF